MLGKLSVTVMLLDYTVNADVDIFNIFCLFAAVVFMLIFFFFFNDINNRPLLSSECRYALQNLTLLVVRTVIILNSCVFVLVDSEVSQFYFILVFFFSLFFVFVCLF